MGGTDQARTETRFIDAQRHWDLVLVMLQRDPTASFDEAMESAAWLLAFTREERERLPPEVRPPRLGNFMRMPETPGTLRVDVSWRT